MHEVPTDPAHTALLFPGQGSQTAEMREQVERACPHLLEQAIDELGVDPFEHVDDGTAFVQPALYCASLAGGRQPTVRPRRSWPVTRSASSPHS